MEVISADCNVCTDMYTEAHPRWVLLVFLTPLLSQRIWSNASWCITAPPPVYMWPKLQRGGNMSTWPLTPCWSWSEGEARQRGAKHSQSPSATLPLWGLSALWGRHVRHAAEQHHITQKNIQRLYPNWITSNYKWYTAFFVGWCSSWMLVSLTSTGIFTEVMERTANNDYKTSKIMQQNNCWSFCGTQNEISESKT